MEALISNIHYIGKLLEITAAHKLLWRKYLHPSQTQWFLLTRTTWAPYMNNSSWLSRIFHLVSSLDALQDWDPNKNCSDIEWLWTSNAVIVTLIHFKMPFWMFTDPLRSHRFWLSKKHRNSLFFMIDFCMLSRVKQKLRIQAKYKINSLLPICRQMFSYFQKSQPLSCVMVTREDKCHKWTQPIPPCISSSYCWVWHCMLWNIPFIH